MSLSVAHSITDQAMFTTVIDMHLYLPRLHMNVMHVTLLLLMVVVTLIFTAVVMWRDVFGLYGNLDLNLQLF